MSGCKLSHFLSLWTWRAKTNTSITKTYYIKERVHKSSCLFVRLTSLPSLIVDWILSDWWKSSILPERRWRWMTEPLDAINTLLARRLLPLQTFFFFKDRIAQHFYRETAELNTALLTGVHNKVGESLNSSALSISISQSHASFPWYRL